MNARFRGVSSSASTTARCGKIQQLGYDPGDHVVMAGSPRAVSFGRRQIASSCSRRYKIPGLTCGQPRYRQYALRTIRPGTDDVTRWPPHVTATPYKTKTHYTHQAQRLNGNLYAAEFV